MTEIGIQHHNNCSYIAEVIINLIFFQTDQVLSKEILESVFNIDAVLGKDPRTGKPLLVT
jgi:ABC-type cobalamin/Fe3+-siderophores transport system ATPase subunit